MHRICNTVTDTFAFLLQIKFSCPLSQTVTKQISVSNPTDNTVYYLLSFLNNANHLFTVLKPATILRLNAHGSGQVQIQFHAKKIQKSKGKADTSDDFSARLIIQNVSPKFIYDNSAVFEI